MIFDRQFALPNSATFKLAPVAALLKRYVVSVTIDPFSRDSDWADYANDIDPHTKANYHMDAIEFCDKLIAEGLKVETVLLDPPYSPRQMSESYKNAGRKVGMTETQNARLYKEVKDRLARLLVPGGKAICCGWNSMGFGLNRGFEMLEILLVSHGAAHNDTIVTVEIYRREQANIEFCQQPGWIVGGRRDVATSYCPRGDAT